MRIPYSLIGCEDAERTGDMFIMHFDARDGEMAKKVGDYLITTEGGDAVGCVVLNHAQPVDDSVLVYPPEGTLMRIRSAINEDVKQIAEGDDPANAHSFKWHTDRKVALDEYLAWWESTTLE